MPWTIIRSPNTIGHHPPLDATRCCRWTGLDGRCYTMASEPFLLFLTRVQGVAARYLSVLPVIGVKLFLSFFPLLPEIKKSVAPVKRDLRFRGVFRLPPSRATLHQTYFFFFTTDPNLRTEMPRHDFHLETRGGTGTLVFFSFPLLFP